jgi:Family of unknown function (DUF6188)
MPNGDGLPALAGWRVDCCCVDDEARLLFFYPPAGMSELDSFEIGFRAPVRLRLPNEDERALDPRGPRRELGPFLALFGLTVTDATVVSDGGLTIDFDDGARLTSPPHPRLQAWEIRGPRDSVLVCLPGGDAVRFGREQPRASMA